MRETQWQRGLEKSNDEEIPYRYFRKGDSIKKIP